MLLVAVTRERTFWADAPLYGQRGDLGQSPGWTRKRFGEDLDESAAWRRLARHFPGIAAHLIPFAHQAKQRSDQGDYWWELRPCDYYDVLGAPKIVWPDVAKFPRFSLDTAGHYLGNTCYFIASDEWWLLGYLASRCT